MSSGQYPRNPIHFPRMNDRAGRRRIRRRMAWAHQFAAALTDQPYNYGGIIRPRTPMRATIALDECVLVRRDGALQCGRTDPEHLATDRHWWWAQPVDYMAIIQASLTDPFEGEPTS